MGSPLESTIEVTPLAGATRGQFTNANPLWNPPGARGVYGGILIAQSLAAGQKMVSSGFTVHSMHCLFINAGRAGIPIIYEVEVMDDTSDRVTETVHAKQEESPIFKASISFLRATQIQTDVLSHFTPKPHIPLPPISSESHSKGEWDTDRPFQTKRIEQAFGIYPLTDDNPHCRPENRKFLQWMQARGQISAPEGDSMHSCALAYMSDNFFIGTVARAQHVPRFSSSQSIELIQNLGLGHDDESKIAKRHLQGLAEQELADFKYTPGMNEQIGMMVSLSHSIYFHHHSFRADEWMLSEMSSPWAGEGRGLVAQSWWTQSGILLATCVQEGVVRLVQDVKVDIPPESKL
ncbi:acyl-CoA thioesterase II [Penicillium malachiteum]|uniref:acyl-CoA thioesterase II n=1 Tax=Penicillium malachiteum TaxID=1324776 RepID=UPI002546CBAB|nr:acyl-CoA thioesterase II [Penicillium malachiteum]KAJ5713713.1 acyl-CoA thioesterase II [Penicillium malachiteum]